MLPDLSPQTTRAFADVTHHAVAGHAAIGQILISFVEDGKLMVSDDLSEEELDDLGLAGEITVENRRYIILMHGKAHGSSRKTSNPT
jgi:hypothetical protein